MAKKGDVFNSEFQNRLEEAVLQYQQLHAIGNQTDIALAYKKITNLYDPLEYYHTWYDQYKYLFDSQDDFVADYLRVFATVLLGWKPRSLRKESRYEGSGEFKNYFIGSLYHNYINLVKSDQAAKRNVTKRCPICGDWVNPISTHLIIEHSHLLWDCLSEMDIEIESLVSCPFCVNFKISKDLSKKKVVEQIKAHFISKHTPLLFNKFNELYPDVSTVSPKIVSSLIEEGDDTLDVYDITEDQNSSLLNKLYLINLSDVEKDIVQQILNGTTNLAFKPEKYKCTIDEWEHAIENLKEAMYICGYQ
jgi:hypothetical protein